MSIAAQLRGRWIAGAGLVAAVATIVAVALLIARGPVADVLERLVGSWQNALAHSTGSPAGLHGWRLYAAALGGGLVASLSPCILAMLPVNLSYVGATGLRSRRAALRVASAFVAGVVVVNVVLGLVSSLFFAVFVQYRGFVNLGVGILTILMGLWLAGAIAIRMPGLDRIPLGSGPLVAGVAFALVASPCASPILVSVLAAAGKEHSLVTSIVAMTLYTLGYTAVLFLASLFAGVAAASRRLLAHGELLTRVAAVALLLLGIGTAWYGVELLRA